jgi:hypothetical protein
MVYGNVKRRIKRGKIMKNRKRVYYYNDNYSEFESIYGYKMIEYQHKGNLFAQFKKEFKK